MVKLFHSSNHACYLLCIFLTWRGRE